MPRGDRTGPEGMGSMTGRGAGYCSGNVAPGFANAGLGRGMGLGRGTGRGMGRGFNRGYVQGYPVQGIPVQPVPESDILANQAKSLENQLKIVKDRLSQLEGQSGDNQ